MSLSAQAKKRLLIVSLVGAFLLFTLGSALVIQVVRHQRMYAAEKERGLAAAAKGDDATVVHELANYLRRYPSDMDALTAFANSRMKSQVRPADAIRETANALRRILTLDPTRNAERRRLMEVYGTFNYMTEALEQATALLASVPGDAEATEMKIRANIVLHHYDDAIKAAGERLAASPTDWIVQVERVDAMQKAAKTADEINKTVAGAIAGHEQDQGALFLQGYAAHLNNDLGAADGFFKTAATKPVTDADVGANLVEQLDELNEHSAGMKVMATLVAQMGRQPREWWLRTRELWLRRLWEDGRFAEAADFAAGPASEDLGDATSLGLYADSLRRLGKDSSAVLKTLDDRKDDPRAAAWVAIEKAESNPTQDTEKLARSACETAMKGSGLDAQYVLYFQANFEAILGDTDLAIEHWKTAALESRSWAMPWVQRGQAQLARNHPADAEQSLRVAWDRAGGQPFIAITTARIWFAEVEGGDSTKLDQLNSLIDNIQKYSPNEEITGMMRATLQARAGQTDQAKATLRGVLGKQPPPAAQTLLTMADVSRSWKLGIEQECMDEYDKLYGVTAQAALAEAIDDFQKTHKPENGLKLIQDGAASAKGAQAVYFGIALASFREMTADPSAAVEWKALGDKYPDDASVQRAALTSQAAYGDRDFYNRTINRVKTLAGDNATIWKLARAHWLLDGPAAAGSPEARQVNDDALALLNDVLKANPDSVPALVLASEAKRRNGDTNGAAEMMANAQRLDPTSSAMSLNLAQMLQSQGNFEGARTQLEMAASDPKATPTFKEKTAVMLASQGDVDKAIALLEPLAAGPDANESIKLHLAAFYCRAKAFDKAQAISDELMKTPDSNTILLAAQIQMFQRRPDAAQKILEQLKGMNLSPSRLEQTLGDFDYMFNRLDLALVHYSASTQPAPTDATPWLSLIDTQVALGHAADVPATVNEALKHVTDEKEKAPLLGLQKENDLLGHIGNSRTERQLLADLIKNPSDDNPAVKVLQVVVPLEKGDASPSEILQKLQQLTGELPQYLPAQTGLTEAQLRFGRCEDAIQSANRAAAAFPNDPWPTELATRALSLTGRWDEALAAARAWRERVVGDTLNADMAIAEIQLHMRDADGALTSLQKYETMPELAPEQKWQIYLTEARALVMQNKPDDAGNKLWPMVQTLPSVRATWQSFVILYLPAASAEQWFRKLQAQLESEPGSERQQIVLAQSWDILARRTGNKDDAALARQMAVKLEAVPASAAYSAFAMGTFLEEDGDFAGAQAAYRQALDKQPDLTDARNNLAEVLADHGGDLTEAIKQARQCVATAPTASYYDTLADILSRGKQYDDALAQMRQATQNEPDNAKWRVHLAKLLADAGKPDEAKLAIAELDLMTPGAKALPQNYKDELDALRKQLNAPSVSAAH